MNLFGLERPDPIRPLLQALVEIASGAASFQATDQLKRYDILAHASESLCSSASGAQLWLAAVDELLEDGQQALGRATE